MVSLGRFSTLYRSTLFQIVIVGLVAFCEPGIWTALNNLGAGGNAKVGSCRKPASGGNNIGEQILLTFLDSLTSTMPPTRSHTG
jgi:hypothetical protein